MSTTIDSLKSSVIGTSTAKSWEKNVTDVNDIDETFANARDLGHTRLNYSRITAVGELSNNDSFDIYKTTVDSNRGKLSLSVQSGGGEDTVLDLSAYQAYIDELKKVILSCQRHNKYFTIEVTGFRVVDDYAEINDILYRYYENASRNKSKMKKRDNQYAFINLNDSDIRLLIVSYHIETPLAVMEEERKDDFSVIIAVPRIVDKYYFHIHDSLFKKDINFSINIPNF